MMNYNNNALCFGRQAQDLGLTKAEKKKTKEEEAKKAYIINFFRLLRIKKMNTYSLCFPSNLSQVFPKDSQKKSNEKVKRIRLSKFRKINNLQFAPFDKLMTIRIKPNNMFCTLTSVQLRKKVICSTATKYRIRMSKKIYRYNYKLILNSFYEEAKPFIGKKMLISITAPKRVRRDLLQILKKKLFKNKRRSSIKTERVALFNLKAKKCFNGCRARKIRRRKHKGLRIYKS